MKDEVIDQILDNGDRLHARNGCPKTRTKCPECLADWQGSQGEVMRYDRKCQDCRPIQSTMTDRDREKYAYWGATRHLREAQDIINNQ